MYKLIIVEDEEIVRSGLKNGTDWAKLGFEVAGTASNGIEALELIEKQSPDVVLTDIRMPDMDGIELMKILRQRHSDVEIVILSGYGDFEYARSAVKYGAFEYLTKPVDDEEFKRVFEEVHKRIRNTHQKLYNNINEKTGVKSLDTERLRNIFLSTLFSKPLNDDFIYKSINDLNINFDENGYCIAAMHLDNANGYKYDLLNLLKGKYVEFLNYNDYPYVVLEGSCIILMSRKAGYSYYDLCKDIKKYKESLHKEFNNDLDMEVFINIGISNLHSGLKEIRTAYEEALTALKFKFYKGNDRIITYSELNLNNPDTKEYESLNNLINDLIENILVDGNMDWSRNARKIFEFIRQAAMQDVTYVRIKCLEILVILDNKLKDKGINIKELGRRELLYRDIFNKGTLDDLQSWFISKLDYLLKASENTAHEQEKTLIQQVKSYILKNIREKIYLNEIAAAVHMSPNYLSAAFTKETGLNLSKYIMDVKIEKAKEYLTESDMRIQEISDALGFSDYRYFSTVFKKETGITPLDYRTRY